MRSKIIQEHTSIAIGELTLPMLLTLSARRKRSIALKVAEQGLMVAAPLRTSKITVQNFIHRQKPWILKQWTELQHRQTAKKERQFISGEKVCFLGNQYVLCVKEDGMSDCRIMGEELHVGVQIAMDSQHYKQVVFTALTDWYRQQALIIVQQRLLIWQELLRVKPTQVKITHARKRWGSCSAKNSICISWQVALLPLPLLDYILVHELCHIVHKNHSPRFWQLVGKVMPDYKERDKAVNNHEMLTH